MAPQERRGIPMQPMTERLRQDRQLIRTFYMLITLALIGSLVYTLGIVGKWGFTYLLYVFVQTLMAMFFLIGFATFLMRHRRGYVRSIDAVATVAAISLALATATVYLDRLGFGIRLYIQPPVGAEILAFGMMSSLVTILMNFIWAFLISFGVIGVTCAFLRKNIPRLLAYISSNDLRAGGFRNRLVASTFAIPDIIDIRRVEVGPAPEGQTFPVEQLKRNFILIMYFAVLVPSYVLLNPLFLQQTAVDLVSLALGASLFIPVIIFPFSSVIDSKARAVSQARDFNLGKGFRRTIMGFLGWGTVLLLLILTIQIRSIVDIVSMYTFYLVVAVFVAMIYIFIYYNYFQNDLVRDIVDRFNELDGR